MKIMPLATLLVVMMEAQALGAVVKFDKQVNPGKLRKELEAASFQVENLRCDGTACTLILAGAEKKNPAAIIAAHVFPDFDRERRRDDLRALIKKWRTTGLTPAEKDDLLIRLAEQVMGKE